jgi:RNA-directed DNA polymerase
MLLLMSTLSESLPSHIRQDSFELEVAYCVGGVLSPLLANLALGVLDEHLAGRRTTTRAQRRGQPSVRLIRYADDWVVLVRGTRAHAEALRDQAAAVLAPMGLRLSVAKTRICHLDAMPVT